MPSSPLQQVPNSAFDAAGLSITTSIRSASDLRPGAVYDPVNLAAAVPIHFHPTTSPSLGGSNFLMLNSQRWTAGTLSTTNPGAYSAWTVDSQPNWVEINAVSGAQTGIRSGFDIPMNTAADSRTLTAAVSRGTDLLWILNSVTQGSTTLAVVQQWQYNTAINVLQLLGEEIIPVATSGGDTIVFDDGLRWSTTINPYLYAYGLGSGTGHVYMARKAWARVGSVGTATAPLDSQWEVYAGTGWNTDPTAQAVVATTGTKTAPMTSVGPLSFAHYGMLRAQKGRSLGLSGYDFMATVVASGNARSAQIFSSLGGRTWKSFGSPIALGTVNTTYTGANVQFQGSVGPNPALVDAVASASAIPYCYTTKATNGGASSLVVTWNLLQVPRLS